MHPTPSITDARGPGRRHLDPPASPAAPTAPRLRVAYLLKRYPRLSQTFVLNEMLELERQGVEGVVLARDGLGEGMAHPATRLLRAPVHELRAIEPDEERWEAAAAALLRELRVDHVHAHFA